MFHYNNNNNDNPFEYSGTDDHHINENPNPCFLSSFPSHLLDDDDLLLSHFLHHHHQEHQHIPPSPPQQNSPPPPPPPVPDTDTTPADDDQAGVRINTSAANHHHEEPSGSKNNKATKEAPKKSSATRKSAGVKKPAVEGTTPKRRRTTPASGTTTRKPAGSGAPRRRTGKKDRHSKIYTAHGPRDRRMRLSLQIARKFFDLQDMLGFDKASKTIEWLFTKSKSAIKEITTASMLEKNKMSCGGASTSSTTTTDCIVSMVGMELESRDNYNEAADHHDVNVEDQFGREKSRKGTNKLLGSSSSTSSLQPVITNPAKEKREKARARARERTNEKRLKKEMDQQLEKSLTNPNCNNNNNYNLDKFGSSSNSTPETGDQELSAGCPSAHEFNSSENCNNNNNNNNNNTTDHQHYSLQNQMASVGIMEKLLLVTASRSSSSSGPAAAEAPPLDPSIYDHHPDCHQQQQDGSSTGMVSNTAAGLRWPYINSNNDNAFLDHFPGNWVSAGSDGYGEMTSLMMSHHDNIGHDVSQDQNPSTWGTTITTTSGMFLQSQYPDTHFSCNSQDTNSNISLF